MYSIGEILRLSVVFERTNYFILGKNIGFEIFAEKFGKEELEKRIKYEHTVSRQNV